MPLLPPGVYVRVFVNILLRPHPPIERRHDWNRGDEAGGVRVGRRPEIGVPKSLVAAGRTWIGGGGIIIDPGPPWLPVKRGKPGAFRLLRRLGRWRLRRLRRRRLPVGFRGRALRVVVERRRNPRDRTGFLSDRHLTVRTARAAVIT